MPIGINFALRHFVWNLMSSWMGAASRKMMLIKVSLNP